MSGMFDRFKLWFTDRAQSDPATSNQWTGSGDAWLIRSGSIGRHRHRVRPYRHACLHRDHRGCDRLGQFAEFHLRHGDERSEQRRQLRASRRRPLVGTYGQLFRAATTSARSWPRVRPRWWA